jgi:hypothetical protein
MSTLDSAYPFARRPSSSASLLPREAPPEEDDEDEDEDEREEEDGEDDQDEGDGYSE